MFVEAAGFFSYPVFSSFSGISSSTRLMATWSPSAWVCRQRRCTWPWTAAQGKSPRALPAAWPASDPWTGTWLGIGNSQGAPGPLMRSPRSRCRDSHGSWSRTRHWSCARTWDPGAGGLCAAGGRCMEWRAEESPGPHTYLERKIIGGKKKLRTTYW